MDRRTALKILASGFFSVSAADRLSALEKLFPEELSRSQFGTEFLWGVATSAYQVEGAWNTDGRGLSIWDQFSQSEGNIKTGQNGNTACDFYHRYPEDIAITNDLNFQAFRFSLSWPRILPSGRSPVNQKGVDFYNRVIDECLHKGLEPWITLFHWDLPQDLEDRGGWRNRDIIEWFSDYARVCADAFGDRVKNWMVLNEPFAFTALGYLLGMHAPGAYGMKNFLPAAHHAAMCQSAGGRILREYVKDARIGTTQSIVIVDPRTQDPADLEAAKRSDALLNRLFIEASLGMGYPVNDLPVLSGIEKYMQGDDAELLKFGFDFIGIQNYTRVVVKHGSIVPWLKGMPVSPKKRHVSPVTEMGWEVYPEGIYRALKYYAKYPVRDIYVTENGAAFKDIPEDGRVHDPERTRFFKAYLESVLRAKNEGVNVKGYFVWSFLDNFEWAEGYRPRFGLVYVDFKSQERIIKDSGYWFREFLSPGK